MSDELRGLHVVVPAELLAGTYAAAEEEGKTLSEAVVSLLEGYVDKPPTVQRTRGRAKATP